MEYAEYAKYEVYEYKSNTDRDIVKRHVTFKEHEDKEYEYKFHTGKFEENESEVFEEFDIINTGHITIYETMWLEELENLTVEEIIAKYKFHMDKFEENAFEEFDMINTGHITISKTKWLEELKNLTVEEIFAKYVNYSTMASKENLVKQQPAHRSPAHRSPAHSSPTKQPPAKFKTPALAQALATLGLHKEDTHGQHGPAVGGGAEEVHPSDIHREEDEQVLAPEAQQDLAPEDQHKTWHQKTSTDLAQKAIQTEKKPPDNTNAGLIGGQDPGEPVGGQDPGHQVGEQDPILQEGGRDPDQPVGGQDPGHQVGGQDPSLQEGGRDHDHQVGGRDCHQHLGELDHGNQWEDQALTHRWGGQINVHTYGGPDPHTCKWGNHT